MEKYIGNVDDGAVSECTECVNGVEDELKNIQEM